MSNLKSLFLLLLVAYVQVTSFAQDDASSVLERTIPGVVTIAVYKTAEFDKVYGFAKDGDRAYADMIDLTGAKSSGSGFMIEYKGKKYVITNNHVIASADVSQMGSLYAFNIDQKKYEMKIVGGDTFFDLAVLEFVGGAPSSGEVKPLKFRNTECRLAETVYAIGNPLGEYPYSVTQGIISGKNRILDGIKGKFGFLQSTATVIWGNSGGPLVDTNGDVVGINTRIEIKEVAGQSFWMPQMNFALEGILAQRLINSIIDNGGRVKRAYLGLELTQSYSYSWDGSVMAQDDIPVIAGVMPGSPAAAKLSDKIGYSVKSINGKSVNTLQDALAVFENMAPNASVKLGLTKGVSNVEVTVGSGELTNGNLETIAKFFVEKYSTGKLASDAKGVTVTVETEQPQYKQKMDPRAQPNAKPYPANLKKTQSTTSTATIVAAGIVEESGVKDVNRVAAMKDLGVIIRMCAQTGRVDMFINNGGAEYEGVRVFLTQEEDKTVKALYY